YSTFFLLTRASYALDDARHPTMVNLGVTAVTVAGMGLATLVTEGTALLVVFGLVTAAAASTGSLVLYLHIRARIAQPVPVLATTVRCLAAAAAGSAAAAVIVTVVGWSTSPRAVVSAGSAFLVGGAVYVVGLSAL